MEGIRWTGSDRILIDAADADDLAKEVASEILADQYDGYRCVNQYLAMSITWSLCSMTKHGLWRVCTDIQGDTQLEYRVWVVR